MPIRWRLTLWFALIVCAILVLSGAVLHFMIQGFLTNEVDNNLRVYSAKVHGTLNPIEIPASVDYAVLHSKLPPINELTSPGVYIQFIDNKDNIVVKSDNLASHELPISRSLITAGFSGNVSIETVTASTGVRVRIMASPMYLRDQTLLLEVAQSLEPMDTMMNQIRLALLVGILIALSLSVLSGAFLVRRALSPVQRITAIAGSIEASSDLSRRVGYEGPVDEIGKLASTFDHMIEHLDRAFQSQENFVADASHELRSPLTVIKGNLDLLKRNIPQEDREEAFRAITIETNRMVKIVKDLLLLAETASGAVEQSEAVSLKKILTTEFARAQQLAENRIITIDRHEDLAVKGDMHRVTQLLSNLVDNAIKYTPKGGTITLSLFRDNGWACLEVADTGIGIAPEHLHNIFNRFYRVDKARSRAKGSPGLGLAIVKGIAEQMGGKVTVTSTPGKGSTFTAWLKLMG